MTPIVGRTYYVQFAGSVYESRCKAVTENGGGIFDLGGYLGIMDRDANRIVAEVDAPVRLARTAKPDGPILAWLKRTFTHQPTAPTIPTPPGDTLS